VKAVLKYDAAKEEEEKKGEHPDKGTREGVTAAVVIGVVEDPEITHAESGVRKMVNARSDGVSAGEGGAEDNKMAIQENAQESPGKHGDGEDDTG